MKLHLLCAGACQGLVNTLAPRFNAETGCALAPAFGAVGAMRDKLLAGEPCDVIILTDALIAQLEREGHVVQGSRTPIGAVKTGIAVKAGAPRPPVETPEQLRDALLAAPEIYFPDPIKATAGIHFMKVLKALGIAEQKAASFRPFPNGATAMREMAAHGAQGAIGCTQVSEILIAPGAALVADLPAAFELATVYSAGTAVRTADPRQAAQWTQLLASPEAAAARAQAGIMQAS